MASELMQGKAYTNAFVRWMVIGVCAALTTWSFRRLRRPREEEGKRDSRLYEELQKDWLVVLVSVSGVMLTICLAVLAILFEFSTGELELARLLLLLSVGFAVVLAACLLMVCVHNALRALGGLIIAVGIDEKHVKDEKRYRVVVGNVHYHAEKAEGQLRAGTKALVVAIVLSFLFLNWSLIREAWQLIT